MPEVVEQLQRYGEAVEAAVTRSIDQSPAPRRRRAPFAVAGVLLVVAVAVGAARLAWDEPTSVTTSTSGPTGAGDRTGSWSTFAAAPIAGRTGAAAVGAAGRLIVWGGGDGDAVFADGAAFDVDTGAWRTLAASPLTARRDAVSVWTGEEMLVWGGLDGAGQVLGDGAAYDPLTDRWRPLPPLDAGAVAEVTGVAWTGEEMVLVNVQSVSPAFDVFSDTFALDPSAGQWRALDPMPASAREVAVRWSGSVALVVSFTDGAPVVIDRLDVESGAWGARVETDAAGLDTGASGVAIVGTRLVIVGHAAPGVVLDLAIGTVTPLAPSESRLRFPAVALGGAVVVGERWLDPRRGDWLSTGPVPGPIREFPVAVEIDGRLHVWGGSGCGAGAGCSGLIDPEIGVAWDPPTVVAPDPPSAGGGPDVADQEG